MTTFKGAMRSVNAAVNRMEREQQRRNREIARQFKEQQKIQAIQNAESAVDKWERYIETIQSIHKDCSNTINWTKIKNTAKPVEPKYNDTNEKVAKTKLEIYKPSFIDKLFGLTKNRIQKLQNKIAEANSADRHAYEKAIEKFQDDLEEWENQQTISNGILEKKPEYYAKALEYYQPFSDISELGVRISFSIDKDFIDVDLHANSDDIVPDFILSLTSTGKLSKKNMPKTRFIELYQDHICSAILRVAREVFAILPVDYVRVNALSNLLNTQNGFMEEKPILSVIIRPDTLKRINFNTIDPSDCMKNFIHSMNFKKSTGFEAVEKATLLEAETV